MKSLYMTPENDGYEEQLAFDRSVAALPGIDLNGYGPTLTELESLLRSRGQTLQDVAQSAQATT